MIFDDLDELDRKLLSILQEEGRITNAELAERVHLSPSSCHRRMKALEDGGIILGYRAILNARALGRADTVFVEITLSSQSEEALDAFERAVRDCADVLECHLMAGDADYLLRLAVADTADYERIHRAQLARLPHIARMRSNFALRQVHSRPGLPLR